MIMNHNLVIIETKPTNMFRPILQERFYKIQILFKSFIASQYRDGSDKRNTWRLFIFDCKVILCTLFQYLVCIICLNGWAKNINKSM